MRRAILLVDVQSLTADHTLLGPDSQTPAGYPSIIDTSVRRRLQANTWRTDCEFFKEKLAMFWMKTPTDDTAGKCTRSSAYEATVPQHGPSD